MSTHTFNEGMELLRDAIKVMLRLVVPWRTVITYKEGASPGEQHLCFAHFAQIPDPKDLVILTDPGMDPDRNSDSYQSFIRQLSGTNLAYQDTSKPYWRLYVTAHDRAAISNPSGHPFKARLTLAFNHAIYDGLCATYFFEQLASILQQGSRTFDSVPVVWPSMPPTIFDLWKLPPDASVTTVSSREMRVPDMLSSNDCEPERFSPFIIGSQDSQALLEQCRLYSASISSMFSVCAAISCHYAQKDVGDTPKQDVLTLTPLSLRPGMPATCKLIPRQYPEPPLAQHAEAPRLEVLRNRWIGIYPVGNIFKSEHWRSGTSFWQACAELRRRFPLEPDALQHIDPLPNRYDATNGVIWTGYEESALKRMQALHESPTMPCLASNIGRLNIPLHSEWEFSKPLAGVSATEFDGISFALTSLDDTIITCTYDPMVVERKLAERSFERLQSIIRRICTKKVGSEMTIHSLFV